LKIKKIVNKKKAGYSHRAATTAYPCYLPVLGSFSRSWPYETCQAANIGKFEVLK